MAKKRKLKTNTAAKGPKNKAGKQSGRTDTKLESNSKRRQNPVNVPSLDGEDGPVAVATESQDEALSKSMTLAVHDLEQNVDSLRIAFSRLLPQLESANDVSLEAFRSFTEAHDVGHRSPDNPNVFVPKSPFPAELLREFRRRALDTDKTRRAHVAVTRSFLVSLCSVFDLFVSSMFHFVLAKVPKILNEKGEFNYERLCTFASIDDARLHLVEHEIDTQLRESRATQLAWFDRKIGVNVAPNAELLARVVELEQRRNSFVHNDGRVTKRYLSICKDIGFALPEGLTVGHSLLNNELYFRNACFSVLEMGMNVSQLLWRKILPGDGEADKRLCNFGVDRIIEEQYDLAINVLKFPIEENGYKFCTAESEYRCLLNLAQAHKWNGNREQCERVIVRKDFSATKSMFRLGKSCLEERYDDAFKLMEEIGDKSSDIEAHYYSEWPIFRGLREQPEFPNVFTRIFGTDKIKAKPVELTPLKRD
jgi:hypothetical protein